MGEECGTPENLLPTGKSALIQKTKYQGEMMKIKTTRLSIPVAIIVFFAALQSAVAYEEKNRFDELSSLDSFHPPISGDPRILMYKEWHYFNFLDDKQNLSFITTLTLGGNISDPAMSSAIVLMNYTTPDKNDLMLDVYPVSLAKWSDKSPDLRIARSYVELTEEGYHVHVESKDAHSVLDAIFKPEADPAPVFNAMVDPSRVINWIVASPKMKVNGELTINKGTPSEKTYSLKNVKGYHDHNWGYWLWQDDLGWDWGQASEIKYLNDNNPGKYTFSFGNITNNNHTESKATVLEVWKNRKIISAFRNDEVRIHRDRMMTLSQLPNNPFPLVTVLNAKSGDEWITLVFTTEHVTPIMLPVPGGYRIIWELTGEYNVSGYIDGKPLSYHTKGYLEYVAELLLL